MGNDSLDEKSCLDLHRIAQELQKMLDGITHDFYRHREEYSGRVGEISASTVSSMKKTVLKTPLILAASAREAAGRYEVMRDLEHIRLNLEGILRATQDKVHRSVLFSNWAIDELDTLFAGAGDILSGLSAYLRQCSEKDRGRLMAEADKLIQNCAQFTWQHEDRFIKGICTPESADIYQSMLDSFRDIFRHVKSCIVKVYRL